MATDRALELTHGPVKGSLEIHVELFGQDPDRPEAVRELVLELGSRVGNRSDTGLGLDELGKVADVSHETQRDLGRRPGAAVEPRFELFVERTQLHGARSSVAESHWPRHPTVQVSATPSSADRQRPRHRSPTPGS